MYLDTNAKFCIQTYIHIMMERLMCFGRKRLFLLQVIRYVRIMAVSSFLENFIDTSTFPSTAADLSYHEDQYVAYSDSLPPSLSHTHTHTLLFLFPPLHHHLQSAVRYAVIICTYISLFHFRPAQPTVLCNDLTPLLVPWLNFFSISFLFIWTVPTQLMLHNHKFPQSWRIMIIIHP